MVLLHNTVKKKTKNKWNKLKENQANKIDFGTDFFINVAYIM